MASAVGIVVGAVTLGTGTSIGIAIAAGAAGGAAGALTGALLNGANIGQIAKATFWGGFWGAASSCLNHVSTSKNFMKALQSTRLHKARWKPCRVEMYYMGYIWEPYLL